jgi:hypothetical protein
MSQLWLPGASAGPVDEFVARLHRHIERFARHHEIEKPAVEVELQDGARYAVDAIAPEPGFGFVTIKPHNPEDDDEIPDELIVPVGAIRRIELSRAEDERARFGFTLPAAP